MHKTTTILTVGAALLLVALNMAVPAAAAGSCTLGPTSGTCAGSTLLKYHGQNLGIDDSASLFIDGNVTSRFQESLFPSYWIQYKCVYVLGTNTGCAMSTGNGGPWIGFSVDHVGILEGVAVFSVDATWS